jgi:hypothetical protein
MSAKENAKIIANEKARIRSERYRKKNIVACRERCRKWYARGKIPLADYKPPEIQYGKFLVSFQ